MQHFLLSYRDALAEICRAQMTNRKRLEVETTFRLNIKLKQGGSVITFFFPLPGFYMLWTLLALALSAALAGAQGGLAGVLNLLEGDEFVRGILEPAGLTLEELARPSVMESYRKLNAPPPVQGPAQPQPLSR